MNLFNNEKEDTLAVINYVYSYLSEPTLFQFFVNYLSVFR